MHVRVVDIQCSEDNSWNPLTVDFNKHVHVCKRSCRGRAYSYKCDAHVLMVYTSLLIMLSFK